METMKDADWMPVEKETVDQTPDQLDSLLLSGVLLNVEKLLSPFVRHLVRHREEVL
jgi:hypothetical protein